jgi:hypothetical protein
MFIRCKNPSDNVKACIALKDKLEESRFTATVFPMSHRRHKEVVRIETVRLRIKKDYCGQHPCACVAVRKHRKGHWLEGADWIGFNDLLNLVLDELQLDADVWSYNREARLSNKYMVRIGRKRRICYGEKAITHHWQTFFLWDGKIHACDFEDCIGKQPPQTEYPYGTPGLAEWRRDAELALTSHGDE